jgi:hypothetical protein
MKWNKKQKNIGRASTCSMNLIMKKDCKSSNDDKMDCVMMIAKADWIAKTKEYKSAYGKSRSKTYKRW